MTDYTSNIDLSEAAKLIRRAGDNVLVTTHVKPDGDAFGSVVALVAAMRQLGQQASGCLMPPVLGNLMRLSGAQLIQVHDDAQPLPEPSLVIVLDSGAWSQLMPLREQLERWTDRMLIIDHHTSGDVPATWRYVDTAAAACCEIVAELIDQMAGNGDELISNPTIAQALFVGLASDTGWFRFSNTRPQTHELAARLLRDGVDHAELYRVLEQMERPEKLALLIRAVDSLQLLANGRAAVMTLCAADFRETGALSEETERLVDIPQMVASVQAVVLITEPPDDANGDAPPIRMSFRSKPGPDAIDVAELARQFGGGGHARAAGAKVAAPLQQVVQQVGEALSAAVQAQV